MKKILQMILEANWIDKVKTKWEPPEDTFSKGTPPSKTAKILKDNSKDLKQAMSRLNFFINRGGMCDKGHKHYDKEWCQQLNKVKDELHKLYGEK